MGQLTGQVRRHTRSTLTGTFTFYSAATSGAAATTRNTMVFVEGVLISWTQTVIGSGSGGALWFDDADHSAHIITTGIA